MIYTAVNFAMATNKISAQTSQSENVDKNTIPNYARFLMGGLSGYVCTILSSMNVLVKIFDEITCTKSCVYVLYSYRIYTEKVEIFGCLIQG